MHQEDDFSFDQIPDFLAAFPDLDSEIFSERDTEPKMGSLSARFCHCEMLCCFRKW